VLVVDDDSIIVQMYREVLSAQGYTVVTAHSCAEATARMDEIKGEVDVMLVDLGLPDGDGAELARMLAAKHGSKPTMYVSGWTDEFWQLQDAPGRWLIIPKPVPLTKLIAAVKWLEHGGDKPAELL
jgi:two-component system, OmpR family, KDP operon response regulator KdpE